MIKFAFPVTGCIDRAGIERGEGTTWPTSECETCTCRVRK